LIIIKKLYEIKEGYDAKIMLSKKSNIKEFHVNFFILKIQLNHLSLLKKKKKKDGYFNVNAKLLEILLRYFFSVWFLRTLDK